MKRARQKLHSRGGASILLALLLMFVAVMISTVILSAAVSSAHRVVDDRSEQQDALSIASAGKLMVQYLKEHNSYWTVTYNPELIGYLSGPDESYGPIANSYDLSGFPALREMTEAPNKTCTLNVSAPNGMRAARMTFTPGTPYQSAENTYEYHILGTITLEGGTAVSQKLYLSFRLIYKSISVPAIGYEYKQTGIDENEEPVYGWEPIGGLRTTDTWELIVDGLSTP